MSKRNFVCGFWNFLCQDNQLAVNIQMCEGERTMTRNHHLLMKTEFGGLSRGTHSFSQRFGHFLLEPRGLFFSTVFSRVRKPRR